MGFKGFRRRPETPFIAFTLERNAILSVKLNFYEVFLKVTSIMTAYLQQFHDFRNGFQMGELSEIHFWSTSKQSNLVSSLEIDLKTIIIMDDF